MFKGGSDGVWNIDGYTVRKFRTVRKEGNRMVIRNMDYYNLDMIISVGFRVNSHQGIRFRQWANSVLHSDFHTSCRDGFLRR